MIELNPIPNRVTRPDTIDDDADSFFGKLPQWGLDLIGLYSQFSAGLAGGSYTLSYQFDATTTDSDPGTGKLRLSNVIQNASTAMRLDTMIASQDVTSILDTFDASTSTIKGSIKLVKANDLSKWLMFDVTARATPTGYRNISVNCTASSAASPFTTGDQLVLMYTRNGDKGDTGQAGGPIVLLGSATISTAVANVDFLNVFTSAFDKYIIEIEGAIGTGTSALYMRLAKAGVVDSSATYAAPGAEGSSSTFTSTGLAVFTDVLATGIGASGTVEIRNVNDSTPGIKSIGIRGMAQGNSQILPRLAEGGYNVAGPLSGFRLYWVSGTTFAKGIIRVYGIKNT